MPNGNTVKHGWILLLFVSLYITKRSEAVLQWGEKKKYQKNVERNVLNVIDYLYNYTKIKKYNRDTGRFWQVSFLYSKMGNKTSRDRFSVYR